MQLEQSERFTKIPYKLLAKLITFNLTKEENRIIRIIKLKTYGFNKKKDWIAMSQFISLSLMTNRNVNRTIRKLKSNKIINVEINEKEQNIFSINENTDEWIEYKNIKSGSDVILKDENIGSGLILSGSDVILNDLKMDQARSKSGSGLMHTIEYKQKNINITLETYTKEYATKDVAYVCDNLNSEESMVKNDYAEEFEIFYNVYPHHKGREPAFKTFKKLKPNKELLDKMINAIDMQKQEKILEKQNTGFTANWRLPATWLNQKGWTDEIETTEILNMGVTTNANRKPTNAQDRLTARSRMLRQSLNESLGNKM